jgi:hypothetical protein
MVPASGLLSFLGEISLGPHAHASESERTPCAEFVATLQLWCDAASSAPHGFRSSAGGLHLSPPLAKISRYKTTDTHGVPLTAYSGIASHAGNLPPRGARGRNSHGVETCSTRFRAPSGESPSLRGARPDRIADSVPETSNVRSPAVSSAERGTRLSAATTARAVRIVDRARGERTPTPPTVGSSCCGRTVRRGVPTRPTGAILFAWMRFPPRRREALLCPDGSRIGSIQRHAPAHIYLLAGEGPASQSTFLDFAFERASIGSPPS